jgi:hypothetical protein
MTGMEMAVNAVIKLLGLNKDDMQKQAKEAYALFEQYCADVKYVREAQERIEWRLGVHPSQTGAALEPPQTTEAPSAAAE